MRFLCVQCDERFESAEERPRCPKCMRLNGIQALDGTKADPTPDGRGMRLAGAGLTVALLLGGGLYLTLGRAGSDEQGGTANQLEALGVDVGGLAKLLQGDEAVEAFARDAAGSLDGDLARAQAILVGLRARAAKQAFVPWSMADPREGRPMVAAEAWAAIQRDGARKRMYPLEVSAVAVAALRALGVEAQMAEIYRYQGEKAPLDPSGCLGYFGFVVSAEGGASQVFDPYGGRKAQPPKGAFVAISDQQAIAAALGTRALHDTVWKNSVGPGLKTVDAALALWPNSVSLRSVRAVLFADNGGLEEGDKSLTAALQLRPDAPRHNNLAAYRLQRRDLEAATKHVTAALEIAPEFASARVVLAGVHMAMQEADLAHNELVEAERLDRGLHTVSLAWAQYYALKGDYDEATRRAELAVAMRPNQPHLQLALARLYRMAGRYDPMRRAARRALELSVQRRQGEMRKMITAVLGPTALEEPQGDTAGSEAADGGVAAAPNAPESASSASAPTARSGDRLDVSRGSKLLGGKSVSGDLQLGKSPRKLGLGRGKLDLKVDLDP